MPIFLKHLVVQEQNEKSNETAVESMCVLALSHGDPSVSNLIFKSKHCRTYLYEREATCLLHRHIKTGSQYIYIATVFMYDRKRSGMAYRSERKINTV